MFDTSWLIVDVTPPGMNGLQLQGQLEATGCRIPIVFIRAYEESRKGRYGDDMIIPGVCYGKGRSSFVD